MKQLTLNPEFSSADNYSKLIDFSLKELQSDTRKNRQKTIEVCHIGKFLMFFDNQYHIEKLFEEPDFIISSNSQRVGLEHQIIIDKKSKENEGYFANLCKLAENELKKDKTLPNFLANIYAHPYFKGKINEKQKLVNEICYLVRHHVITGETPENDIIDRIFSMKHSRISLSANMGAWWQKEITEELIINAIKRKEIKIGQYLKNINAPQWLLIVIGGVGDSSYLIGNDLNISTETKFDKVYILENFNNRLFEIK